MKKSTFKFLAIAMFFMTGISVMAQQFDITFQVDMTNAANFDPATKDVYISGPIGWFTPGDSTFYKMAPTEVGSMFYTLTLSVDSGEVQYKYFIATDGAPSWGGGEWDGNPNRKIYITENSTVENVWMNKPYYITFNVDMSNDTVFNPATDAIYISGSFVNVWAKPGSLSPYMMTAVDSGLMFYTDTLLIYPGNHMYKYFRVIDGVPSWDNSEWVGDPNREVTTDTVAVTFNDVWADISAGIFNEPNIFAYNMYPNPVATVLTIGNASDVNQVSVYDVTGKLVRTVQSQSVQKVTIDVTDLQAGVYIISISNSKGIQTSKFIKN